jgi:hypothetical protein
MIKIVIANSTSLPAAHALCVQRHKLRAEATEARLLLAETNPGNFNDLRQKTPSLAIAAFL